MAAAKHLGDIREKDGYVGCSSRVNRLTGVGTNEQRTVMKVTTVPLVDVGRRAVGVQVNDLDVIQFLTTGDEGGDERLGKGAGAVDVDALSGLDARDGLLGGGVSNDHDLFSSGGRHGVRRCGGTRHSQPYGSDPGRRTPA